MSLIRLFFLSFSLFPGELNHSSLFYGAAKLDGHLCLRSGLPTRINLYSLFCPFSFPTLNPRLIALCGTETKHSFQCNLLEQKKCTFSSKTQTNPVITSRTAHSRTSGKNKKARFPFCSQTDTTANYSNFTFIPAKLISIQRACTRRLLLLNRPRTASSIVQKFPPHLLKLQTKAKMWLWKLIRGCWPYTVIEPTGLQYAWSYGTVKKYGNWLTFGEFFSFSNVKISNSNLFRDLHSRNDAKLLF